MAIEFEIEDISTVDEDLRPAYVENDGKFVFDPEKFYEVKAAGLIAKNREVLQTNKKLAQSIKALEKVKGTAETDVEKLAAEKDQEISELKKQLRESSIWSPVKDLAIKYGVMGDRLEAMMTLLRAQDRFDQDEEGKLIFKDKYGDPTAIKPARAFEIYLKEEHPWAFAASAAGSGAKNDTKGKGSSRIITRERFDSMNQPERDAAIRDGARVVD